jgi:hypothetical protein
MRLFYESYVYTRALEARFSDSVPRFRELSSLVWVEGLQVARLESVESRLGHAQTFWIILHLSEMWH